MPTRLMSARIALTACSGTGKCTSKSKPQQCSL